MTTKGWFALMVFFAFASVISFFQINSYWADQNDFNGVKGWTGLGIVLGIIATYCLYKVSKTAGGSGGGSSTH